MKTCRNCKKFIDDDALVCPYCGCVNRNDNSVTGGNIERNASAPRKKSKLWLWVLGWMCFFPIPLTILVARSKKLNNVAKAVILILFWGILIRVGTKKEKPGDITGTTEIVREMPSQDDTSSESMSQESTAVESTQETTAPVMAQSISFGEVKNGMNIGDTWKAAAIISPENAQDKTVAWTSSNEAVATVDGEGNITALGGGVTTITAKTSNGVENSFDIGVEADKDVDKRLMQVSTDWSRTDDNNIGHEWSYDIRINGERAKGEMEVAVGDNISFSASMEEEDTKPDIGSESASHTVTKEDIMNGFSTSLEVVVTENGGRNKGKSAHFVVTYKFVPK